MSAVEQPDGRSLRRHLGDKRTAMQRATGEQGAAEDWDEVVGAECVADDLTGVRKLRVRQWEYLSDGGPPIGGWNLGPSSPELLCGVTSTCLTHTYLCLAASRGIALDRVQVNVTARNNDARFFGIESDRPITPYAITAEVEILSADLSEAELAQFVADGQAACPIVALIRAPNEVSVSKSESRANGEVS